MILPEHSGGFNQRLGVSGRVRLRQWEARSDSTRGAALMSRWAIFTFVPEALCHQSRVLILERCSMQSRPPWSKISQSATLCFWTELDRWTTNKQPVNHCQLKDVDLMKQRNIVMPFTSTSSLILSQCCELCCFLFRIQCWAEITVKGYILKLSGSACKGRSLVAMLPCCGRIESPSSLGNYYAVSKITFLKVHWHKPETSRHSPPPDLNPPTPRLSDSVF